MSSDSMERTLMAASFGTEIYASLKGQIERRDFQEVYGRAVAFMLLHGYIHIYENMGDKAASDWLDCVACDFSRGLTNANAVISKKQLISIQIIRKDIS